MNNPPPEKPGKLLIRLVDVTLCYQRHPAVHHLSSSFYQGELTALVGPNGAGKSTLLRGMMGLMPPTAGQVERYLPMHKIGYLAQYAQREESFPLSVQEMVAMGHWQRIGWHKNITPAMWQQVYQSLATVGLTGFENRHVGSLSRGQFQRMLFARLVTQDPQLILLDEPFNAMDQRTTHDLLALMTRWHQEGRTIITVLHDMEQVRRHFPHCLLIGRRIIAQGKTHQVLTPENILSAQAMCESWEEGAPTCPTTSPPPGDGEPS